MNGTLLLFQADPEAQIEAEYKMVNDQGWCWRALRLLARKSHHFWAPPSNANQQNKKLSQGLEALIVKVGKDFAGTKEKESGSEEDAKGLKEEGELDEDASAEGSSAVQTNGDEEDEDELLKSGGVRIENGESANDNAWMERDITTDLLAAIARKSDGKSYRKLGECHTVAGGNTLSFIVLGLIFLSFIVPNFLLLPSLHHPPFIALFLLLLPHQSHFLLSLMFFVSPCLPFRPFDLSYMFCT